MTTTSDVKVTPGSGKNVATYSFTGEDSETKELQRVTLNASDGSEIDLAAGTAGSPAGGVSTVQGDPSMTALKIYPLPATPVSGLTSAMTGTSSTAVTGVGAGGSGKFNYITSIVVGNSHATVGTFVEFQDGSGGATFFTVPAAAVYGGAVLTFPTPLKQPTSNTALYCKCTTSGSNTIASVCGFQAA